MQELNSMKENVPRLQNTRSNYIKRWSRVKNYENHAVFVNSREQPRFAGDLPNEVKASKVKEEAAQLGL